MCAPEVESFLTHLAVQRNVAPSTQNQALAAILFLYTQVHEIELPWRQDVTRAKWPERRPVLLTREEVQRVMNGMTGVAALVARQLYGTGMRLMEGVRLRVKGGIWVSNPCFGSKTSIRKAAIKLRQRFLQGIAAAERLFPRRI